MTTPPQLTTRYDLTGRVALIPGGLGSLGQAVIRAFLESGAEVVAAEHSSLEESQLFQTQLGELASHLNVLQTDVTNETEVESLVQSVLDTHHQLDILVNMVGGWAAGQPIADLELGTWDHMLNVNLKTAFLLSKHAARAMLPQQRGCIVHISSRGAVSGRRNAAAYAVAKNAVLALVEIAAEELRDANITVNAVLPSIIDTPANRAGMPDADFSHWPKAEEIAHVLLFLASDDARLISGAAIPVYGRA